MAESPRVAIRIEEPLLKWAEEQAAFQGINISQFIRDVLKREQHATLQGLPGINSSLCRIAQLVASHSASSPVSGAPDTTPREPRSRLVDVEELAARLSVRPADLDFLRYARRQRRLGAAEDEISDFQERVIRVEDELCRIHQVEGDYYSDKLAALGLISDEEARWLDGEDTQY
jgi:hypothetical protein